MYNCIDRKVSDKAAADSSRTQNTENLRISSGKSSRAMISVLLLAAILILAVPQKINAANYRLNTYTVKVETGYLALRTKKEFNSKNEIGKLYTGDTVIECPTSGDESVYRYVYAPSLGKHGYVNGSYLRYKGEYDGEVMYAKVKTGYLVRYAKLVSSADKGAILQ